MSHSRPVYVHLQAHLVPPAVLREDVAVVVDVLRATTTVIHALAAGCISVRAFAHADEAMVFKRIDPGGVVLGGEAGGLPLPGFDAGNSPGEYTEATCRDKTVALTTSNGTRAIELASAADRVLLAGFVNFSAVCEQLVADERPLHVVCAGSGKSVSLEDTLLAGGLVTALAPHGVAPANDGAWLAEGAFRRHQHHLTDLLRNGSGGVRLRELGYDDDITAAGRVDVFFIVPELRRDPVRVEIGAWGTGRRFWPTSVS